MQASERSQMRPIRSALDALRPPTHVCKTMNTGLTVRAAMMCALSIRVAMPLAVRV